MSKFEMPLKSRQKRSSAAHPLSIKDKQILCTMRSYEMVIYHYQTTLQTCELGVEHDSWKYPIVNDVDAQMWHLHSNKKWRWLVRLLIIKHNKWTGIRILDRRVHRLADNIGSRNFSAKNFFQQLSRNSTKDYPT